MNLAGGTHLKWEFGDMHCNIFTRRFVFFISIYQWMSPNVPLFSRAHELTRGHNHLEPHDLLAFKDKLI